MVLFLMELTGWWEKHVRTNKQKIKITANYSKVLKKTKNGLRYRIITTTYFKEGSQRKLLWRGEGFEGLERGSALKERKLHVQRWERAQHIRGTERPPVFLDGTQ